MDVQIAFLLVEDIRIQWQSIVVDIHMNASYYISSTHKGWFSMGKRSWHDLVCDWACVQNHNTQLKWMFPITENCNRLGILKPKNCLSIVLWRENSEISLKYFATSFWTLNCWNSKYGTKIYEKRIWKIFITCTGYGLHDCQKLYEAQKRMLEYGINFNQLI